MGTSGHDPRGARTWPAPSTEGGRVSGPAVAPAAAGAPNGAGGRGGGALRHRWALEAPSAPRLSGRVLPPRSQERFLEPGPPRALSTRRWETALPGTWTPTPPPPPALFREAPRKFKAVAAPPSRPHPHPQVRQPERASTSSPAPLQIHQSRSPAANSSAVSLHSLPLSFLLKGPLATGA